MQWSHGIRRTEPRRCHLRPTARGGLVGLIEIDSLAAQDAIALLDGAGDDATLPEVFRRLGSAGDVPLPREPRFAGSMRACHLPPYVVADCGGLMAQLDRAAGAMRRALAQAEACERRSSHWAALE